MTLSKILVRLRCYVLACCLRLMLLLCIGLARGYRCQLALMWRLRAPWRAAQARRGQAHAWPRRKRAISALLTHVHTLGVLCGVSGPADLLHATRQIRQAAQAGYARLGWSVWLSTLSLASYGYGALLLAATDAGWLLAEGLPGVF